VNLLNVGVVLDPTQTATGAAAVKKEFDGVASASDKMTAAVSKNAAAAGKALGTAGSGGTQAGKNIAQGGDTGAKGLSNVEAAAKRAQAALNGAGQAGGFLQKSLEFAFGGIIERLAEKGLEAALEIPASVIETGLEYDDVIRKMTISLAGMMQQQRPDQIKTWNDAMVASGAVVDQLQKKVQQFHFDSAEALGDTFRSVATGTKGFGLSLQQQIDLASKLMAALRAYNVDGQQASRDTIDLLVGRGERLVAMKEILGAGGMDTFNENLKKVQSGAADPKVLLDQINAAVDKIASAAEHANEVLSTAWGSFKQQIAQALGKETEPLYDELVAQLNRVRTVLQFGNFDALKPFVADLKEAVTIAGNLAVALSTDPTLFKDYLSAGIKWAFSAGMDYLVTTVPRVIPAFIDVVKNMAPALLDLMFAAAAVLNSAIRGSLVAVKGQLGMTAEWGSLAAEGLKNDVMERNAKALAVSEPGTDNAKQAQDEWAAHNAQLLKDTASTNADQRLVNNGGHWAPQDDAAMQKSYYDDQRSKAGDMLEGVQKDIGASYTVPNMLQETTAQLKTAMDDLGNKIKTNADAQVAQAAATKTLHDATVKAYSDPKFVGPIPQNYQKDVQDYQVLNAPGTKTPGEKGARDYIAEINQKILEDQIAINDATATGNQQLIDRAKLTDQVDAFQKKALSDINEVNGKTGVTADQMAHVQDLTARFASSLEAAQGHAEGIKDATAQIALAEEQATAARGRVQQVQQDPFTSQLQKRPELLASYDAEISALQKVIALNQQDINSGKLKDQDAIATRQKEIDSANKEIITARTQASLQTDSGQFQSDITKYMDSLGTAGTNTANIITGTLNTAISATSDNIQKVIDGSETWGQAFQNIGLQILQMLEQLILKMILATAVQAALTAMGGGSGGGLGSLLVSGNHTGGIVGEESSFARTLPRFHNGGVTDDEQLAVLKKGEAVLTPGQMRAISGGKPADSAGGRQVQVHITNISDPSEGARHIMDNPDAILNPLSKRRKQLRALVS
jgi:hypothetical protein